MRTSRTLMTVLAGLSLAPSLYAVELNYQWKKGAVHRFSYEDDSTLSMSMGAMGGMKVQLKVVSTFSEKVLEVNADGTGDVEFTLEQMDLYQDGKKVASLDQIPPAARRVKAEIDQKGRARFVEMVSVYVHEGQVLVGVHKLQGGSGGASASASVTSPDGSVEVDLVASIDVKNGKIVAATNVREKPPALKQVKVKREDPMVDALPKQILEMMVLPEGQLAPGGSIEMDIGVGKLKSAMEGLEKGIANLKLTLTSATDAPKQKGGDEGEMPDMGAMTGGMMGGMVGGSGAGAGDMGKLSIDANVSMQFDTKEGKMLQMSGTLSTKMGLGGMGGMKADSTFSLKRK